MNFNYNDFTESRITTKGFQSIYKFTYNMKYRQAYAKTAALLLFGRQLKVGPSGGLSGVMFTRRYLSGVWCPVGEVQTCLNFPD